MHATPKKRAKSKKSLTMQLKAIIAFCIVATTMAVSAAPVARGPDDPFWTKPNPVDPEVPFSGRQCGRHSDPDNPCVERGVPATPKPPTPPCFNKRAGPDDPFWTKPNPVDPEVPFSGRQCGRHSDPDNPCVERGVPATPKPPTPPRFNKRAGPDDPFWTKPNPVDPEVPFSGRECGRHSDSDNPCVDRGVPATPRPPRPPRFNDRK
ncbi:hypothetical protein HDV05_002505 [Chytridiales sp. JEL 0842]|nr:hypothetical protein HDV05_002505 [Chytridiales sp. JEL 0842]